MVVAIVAIPTMMPVMATLRRRWHSTETSEEKKDSENDA
jgi:hypothetical protein